MGQTRLESFIEALLNIFIGYIVAVASQIMIFPMFGVHLSFQSNLWMGAWFTLISLIRSYIIRRYFNARLHKVAHAMAATHSHK